MTNASSDAARQDAVDKYHALQRMDAVLFNATIDGVSMIRAIFGDPRLSLHAKAAATLLIAHSDIETRKTVVGMRDAARAMGVSRSTAIVAFNELRQAAWLYSELVPGRRGLRAYVVMPDADAVNPVTNGDGAP